MSLSQHLFVEELKDSRASRFILDDVWAFRCFKTSKWFAVWVKFENLTLANRDDTIKQLSGEAGSSNL